MQPQKRRGITQLFPQPPTQCFQAPVVPPTEGRNMQYPVQRQSHMQRGSQDIKMDPCFRPPPPTLLTDTTTSTGTSTFS